MLLMMKDNQIHSIASSLCDSEFHSETIFLHLTLSSMAAFLHITSLLNTIHFHFLQPLPCLIFDDTETIKSLCEKIRYLQAFLEGSENKARSVLESEIRCVAQDAEAKIESQLYQLYLCCNQVEHPLKPPQSLYHTLEQVKGTIESIEQRIIQIKSNNNHSAEPKSGKRIENIKAGTFSQRYSEPKDVMVGCDDEFDTIMHKLISHSEKLEVISIVGMGGIGKTTLVRRVYKDASVIFHFQVRAWATVSQEHNLREILLSLLDTNGGDISDLQNQLRQRLIDRRYLIVIDDIWGTQAWDDLHRCFPESFNGSRILITTRLKHVADYASSGNNPHYMRFLNFNESWNLFYKKVFEEKKVSLKFKTIGRGIVEKCQGLPLTIIVVGGLLTSFNQPSVNQWRNIAENLNSLLNIDPEEKCSKILSLSYNHLPPHLKVCFLYFGVFPEDSEIRVKNLIRLWVAEGFLKLELNETMEEVGEAYLQNLVDRGLVQIIKWSFGDKMKYCRVHDVLHNFCLREAQREKLLCVVNEKSVEMGRLEKQHALKRILMRIKRNMSTCSVLKACRWISSQLIYLDLEITRERYDETDTPLEFRSILYFGWDNISSNPFPCFEVLRLLDISSRLIREHHLPSEIVNLVNLRYLALRTDEFFPDLEWFKLRNLQTLIVFTLYTDVLQPKPEFNISDMPQLRHVYLNGCFLNLPTLVQGNLQALSWLNLPLQGLDFKKIPNVKKLGIYIDCHHVLELHPGSLNGLANLQQLENLKIAASYKRINNYFRLLTALPENLKKLSLYHTYLSREDMAIIGTLPNLEILKLIGYAFSGQEWNTRKNEFCRLKYLKIERSGLKDWSSAHFSILECLILSRCRNLEEFPASFAENTCLRLILLIRCRSSLLSSAKQIQEERLGYGDDTLFVEDNFCTLIHREEEEEEENDYAIPNDASP
ncbi:PREDICTED: putative late blight resistance protein homolog R1A-10 [Ipomoea nil]|uniref:putative late blight resistance protein homolog R1A-10 n=1 Tax=Ipomoea nil TaxID=35883 RepID=UPI00090140CE|nr:PREDICTED: putative late blight resistance protein homolog R1A-10 [Ipomoea nil]